MTRAALILDTPAAPARLTSPTPACSTTAFDLSDPEDPQQIQTFAFDNPGNPWNASIDASGKSSSSTHRATP
jgi:hypothetical protein